MDFNKLDKNALAEFLTTDYSHLGSPKPEEYARQIYNRILESGDPVPDPVMDLYLASIYQGPRDVRYTRWDILNLDRDMVNQFAQVLGFRPKDFNADRERILQILTYLDLIYYQAGELLEPTVLQELCSTLPVEDLNKLRVIYKLDTLPCIISVNDPDQKISQLNGLNQGDVKLINHIEKYGSLSTMFIAIKDSNKKHLESIYNNSHDPNILNANYEDNHTLGPTISFSFIQWAIHFYRPEIIKLLVNKGVNLNSNNHSHLISLIHRNKPDGVEMIKFLVDSGADVNRRKYGEIPLSAAIREKQPEVIEYLLQNGATFDHNMIEESLSWLLSCNPDLYLLLEIIKVLVQYGFNINLIVNGILTWLSSYTNDLEKLYEIITSLVQYGFNINLISDEILRELLTHGHVDVLEYLIDHRLNMDRLISGQLLFKILVDNYQYDVDAMKKIRLLIDHGLDPYIQDGSTTYDSSLSSLINKMTPEIVELLVDIGFNNHSYKYPSPAIAAIYQNDIETLDLLIQNGITITGDSTNYWTPLVLAASNNNLNIINRLLETGLDPNESDIQELNPLYYAIVNNNFGMVDSLVQAGADINPEKDIIRFSTSKDMTDYLIKLGAK